MTFQNVATINATAAVTTDQAILSLKMIAAKAGDLPPISAVAMQALQMTADPKISARDLQVVISRDQALAAKILRIVNCPIYCLSRTVSTISHAVAILGMDTLRSIIMAASVQNIFESGLGHGRDLAAKLLTEHSWGAALGARAIAQRSGYSNIEEALLCGLMHDIGKPVLLKNLSEQYARIFNDVYRGNTCFHEAELVTFGFSHAHVGALLADKWSFPKQLSEAIGYHHNPLSAPHYGRLACIVNLANAFMISMELGFEKNKSLMLATLPSVQFLQLDEIALRGLTAEIQAAMQQMSEIMKL